MFAHILYVFHLIWIKFGTGDSHRNVLRDCVCHENQHSERCTFLRGINEFLCLLYTLKCGIRDVRLKLLTIHEFGQCDEGCNFLMTK